MASKQRRRDTSRSRSSPSAIRITVGLSPRAASRQGTDAKALAGS